MPWVLSRITVPAEKNAPDELTIYLLSNGVHLDLVLPVRTEDKDWRGDIPYHNTRSGDTTPGYVAFGWGDKGFYLETPTWDDLTFRTAFRATFGLSTAAMHTTFYQHMKAGDDCVPVAISREQYRRLVTYISRSLKTGPSGKPIVIPTEARYGNNDAFYEAKGRYHLFHTCNTWANNALKVCGQKACWWTPFDKGILYQYRQ